MKSKLFGSVYVALLLCPIIVIFFYRDTEFVSNNMIYLIGISYFFGIPVFCALLMGFAKEPKELPTERNESEEESKSDK
jgi:hypothetical protein